MTDAYALFGYPVAHSWSPFIHGMFARQTQQDLSYRLYESPPERFRSDVLEFFSAGGRGINVTVPHKHAAADLVNELTPRNSSSYVGGLTFSRDLFPQVGTTRAQVYRWMARLGLSSPRSPGQAS